MHVDHAQWDIKLGDDADMKSIGAKYGGQELRINGESVVDRFHFQNRYQM